MEPNFSTKNMYLAAHLRWAEQVDLLKVGSTYIDYQMDENGKVSFRFHIQNKEALNKLKSAHFGDTDSLWDAARVNVAGFVKHLKGLKAICAKARV